MPHLASVYAWPPNSSTSLVLGLLYYCKHLLYEGLSIAKNYNIHIFLHTSVSFMFSMYVLPLFLHVYLVFLLLFSRILIVSFM